MSIKRVFAAGLVFAGVVIAQEASAQSGCFSHRCSPTANNFWPMMHTDNTTCPSSAPSDAGRLDFAHGQGFFRVTLSSDFNILGSVPCVNPGLGIPLCSDPGKSGFIYATDPFNERITEVEFASRQPYICDNGVIRAGSTVTPPTATAVPPTATSVPPTTAPQAPSATPTPNPACADGRDNDGDGKIDLNDPGCSSASDPDENDETQPISLSAECVMSNSDGSKTAFFSYRNPSSSSVTIPIGSSNSSVNSFSPSGARTTDLTVFKPGSVKGAVGVAFSGASVVWSVKPAGGALETATANADTATCLDIVPQANCQGFVSDGSLRVKFGYSNQNGFDITIPVGERNGFTPGVKDRGQPTVFFAGLVPATVDVKLSSATEVVTWNLSGISASNSQLPACSGECFEIPVGSVKTSLDAVAVELANLTKTAAAALREVAASNAEKAQSDTSLPTKKKKRAVNSAEDDFADAEHASAKAEKQILRAKALLLEVPEISKSCPLAPKTCKKVDRDRTIKALQLLYGDAVNSIKRITARTNFRKTGKTLRNDPVVVRAKELQKKGLDALSKLPRFAEDCTE